MIESPPDRQGPGRLGQHVLGDQQRSRVQPGPPPHPQQQVPALRPRRAHPGPGPRARRRGKLVNLTWSGRFYVTGTGLMG